jgi:hypothetical protein
MWDPLLGMTWQGLVVRSRWTGGGLSRSHMSSHLSENKIYISTKEKGKWDKVFFSGGSPLNPPNPPPPLSGEHRAPPPARQGAATLLDHLLHPHGLRTSLGIAPRAGRWRDVVDGSHRRGRADSGDRSEESREGAGFRVDSRAPAAAIWRAG